MPPKSVGPGGAGASDASVNGNATPQATGPQDLTGSGSQDTTPGQASAARPPTGRGNSVQQGSMAAPSPRGRGGAVRRTARPRGIGRRSEQDRAELERAEQERKQAGAKSKAKEAAGQRKRDSALRGRGTMRGRARGGYVGESDRFRDVSTSAASGVFSVGEVSKRASGRQTLRGSGGRGGGGGGGGSSSSGRAGQDSTSGSSGFKPERDVHMADMDFKEEDGGYISSDAELDGVLRKVNIDNPIDLTGDDGESVSMMKPVRIQRIEHKERSLVALGDSASTNPSTTANANNNSASHNDNRRSKMNYKDVEFTGAKPKYLGCWSDSSDDEDAVKPEPMEEDTQPVAPDLQSPPTSPESRRKGKERIKAEADNYEEERPEFQTRAEELEWEIKMNDRRMLLAELGPQPEDPSQDPRAGKVYLWQLPGKFPHLKVKEPKTEDNDINMADVPEAGDDTENNANTKPARREHVGLPAGRVGKLRVHKSGKAYLDWGGIPMEVKMGQQASFLQEVVLVDWKNAKPMNPNDNETSGTVTSMGQIKGHFLCMPDWDKIFKDLYGE